MVIGSGLLGKKFENFNCDFIFFTSGVSDSLCNNYENFQREIELLSKTIEFFPKKVLIYFSSISVHTTNTPYTRHKIIVEEIIKKKSKNYFIFRISQVVGFGGNQNNFFNFMKNKIQHMEEIEVFNTIKSLVDIDDLYSIVTNIITKNEPNQVLDFDTNQRNNKFKNHQYLIQQHPTWIKMC